MRPTLTTWYSMRSRRLKPRSLGTRTWMGVWPPSNQPGMLAPARDRWPFVPRPAVLPLPAAMPRPTRVRALVDPGVGRRSCSLHDCASFLLAVLLAVETARLAGAAAGLDVVEVRFAGAAFRPDPAFAGAGASAAGASSSTSRR